MLSANSRSSWSGSEVGVAGDEPRPRGLKGPPRLGLLSSALSATRFWGWAVGDFFATA